MCLGEVTTTERNRKQEGVGWKVFQIRDGEISGEYDRLPQIKIGVWLKSKDDDSEVYPLGFHVFHTRKEAREWKSRSCDGNIPRQRVRKVRWRDFLAQGTQSGIGLRIIVAKKMMVLE